jgi:hypothetical protein
MKSVPRQKNSNRKHIIRVHTDHSMPSDRSELSEADIRITRVSMYFRATHNRVEWKKFGSLLEISYASLFSKAQVIIECFCYAARSCFYMSGFMFYIANNIADVHGQRREAVSIVNP